METRIILATLCFAMSILSLVRGIYIYKLEQANSQSTSIFNAAAAVATLKLVFFNGIHSRNGIVLMWKANPKQAQHGFDLERKEADGSYTIIAHIDNAGEDSIYRFTDNNHQSTLAYRLRQCDALGRNFYSKPVLIEQC